MHVSPISVTSRDDRTRTAAAPGPLIHRQGSDPIILMAIILARVPRVTSNSEKPLPPKKDWKLALGKFDHLNRRCIDGVELTAREAS